MKKSWFVGLTCLLALGPACTGSDNGNQDASVEDARDGDGNVTDEGRPDGGEDGDGYGDDGGPPPGPLMGILQFRIKHNLMDDSCVARGDCVLETEEEDDLAGWLSEIGEHSNLAVLHWDRSIPWLVFADTAPAGTDRVTFYNQRLDPAIRSWIDAFEAHFASTPRGYLAVTPLHGDRSQLERCRLGPDLEDAVVSDPCPELGPGTLIQFEYDPGAGPVTASFDLEVTYRNFILYLNDRLQPDYFALMIEMNMFKESCPQPWDGLVELYRALYDAVRAEVEPETKVFATLTYMDLLDYEIEQCCGELAFEACVGSPSEPDYPEPDHATCYPLDLSAISDLDQGDRLDILALSFYPDILLMATGDDNLLYAYPEDWDGSGDCLFRTQAPPFIDPMAQLDRFGWNKPMAIAELGARSCRTLAWSEEGQNATILQPPGNLASQAFWLEHFLTSAREAKFEFYVQVFLNDYEPLGLWTLRQEVLDPSTYNAFNTFTCMGLLDRNGQPKAGVTGTWLEALR